MTDDNKSQEKEQASVNLIEKLTEAEIAVKEGGWLSPEEVESNLVYGKSIIEVKLKESALEAKYSTERFDFFETAVEMRKVLE